MSGFRHHRQVKLAAVAVLLLVSIPSYQLIPFHRFWGLDLHNHQAFHTCEARNNPYLMTGGQCHDDGGRDMFYPPLLYFAFTWTRWCSLPVAIAIWAVAIVLGTLGSLLLWLRRRDWAVVGRIELGAFVMLLLAQFPVIFAIERGNSDVLVLLLWTGAMALFRAGKPGASGFVAGTAAAMKLYPVFGCFLTGVGLIGRAIKDRGLRKPLGQYAGFGALAVLTAVLAFLPQTIAYLEDEFPRYSVWITPLFVFSHSLQHIAPGQKWVGIVLFAALLVPWTVQSVRLIKSDPTVVFAGGLAIATYFAGTSYDYNLLVVFPLLLLLFCRAFDRERPNQIAFVLLLVGLFAIIGPRSLFTSSDTAKKLHILIEWVWLLATAVAAGAVAEKDADRAEAHVAAAPAA